MTDCGRYLILSIRQGCDPVNRLYFVDLEGLEQGIVGKPGFSIETIIEARVHGNQSLHYSLFLFVLLKDAGDHFHEDHLATFALL